ncbi:MAG: hypothetical protein ACREB5_05570, partial [Sphingomonadaceae bacterium]
MRRAEPRQLILVFADSPQGGSPAEASDASEAKAWLLQRASVKETNGTAARAGEDDRLLEQAASQSNLARALLNVARNKGAAGVDGQSVGEVIEASRLVLPRLRHELLTGRYRP